MNAQRDLVTSSEIVRVMRLCKSPVVMAGDIAKKLHPYPYYDSHNPVYRWVLVTLWNMQATGLVDSYMTVMNQRVWWLTERLK